MEVLIPLMMAKIIDVGIMNGNMGYIIGMGAVLVVMAMLALFFGVKAGNYAAKAGAGYAKTCVMISSIKFSSFPLRTSTAFPRPAW